MDESNVESRQRHVSIISEDAGFVELLYLSRELSWLNFNRRVLFEAENASTPLLERFKYIGIVGSNLDEFMMKRIGGLKQQVGASVGKVSLDGRRPEQQLADCLDDCRRFVEQMEDALESLLADAAYAGVRLLSYGQLDDENRAYARKQFVANVFPLLTPFVIGPTQAFPFIANLSINLLVTLQAQASSPLTYAVVKVPLGGGVLRFIPLQDPSHFILLEDVITHHLDMLFPGTQIVDSQLFRVTRNASTDRHQESAEDLIDVIQAELRERQFAPIVRLEVQPNMLPDVRERLADVLGLADKRDVIERRLFPAFCDLEELVNLKTSPQLKEKPHSPLEHPKFGQGQSVIGAIKEQKSILVHHPFQSFQETVERFLWEASLDPKVRAIKMTLYRTGRESAVVQALMVAASKGKQVAVVVELKARFDEAANLRWARQLEEAGIQVTYGVAGLKTHAKVILIVRQEKDALQRYVHVATGNYNADTARRYTDLGLFTIDPDIGHDATELFNYLTTGLKPKRNYRKLQVAPKLLKKWLLAKIKEEVEYHAQGEEGHIRIKCNALADGDIIDALYAAGRSGVCVELIIRDSCALRPGLLGVSENIRVVSVVGRFLEHSRIYYFSQGGKELYLLGSADLLTRNLERRVEVLVPVTKANLKKELKTVLQHYLQPDAGSWVMRADGTYHKNEPTPAEANHCQQRLIEHYESQWLKATRLRKRKPRGLRGKMG
jgi:polyphosphate kinase